MVIDMIETYYKAGANEKALELAERFCEQLFESSYFFMYNYDYAKHQFESCFNCISYISDLADYFGDKEFATKIRDKFNAMLETEE